MPSSLWPHGPYSPWNSPGQNTGVGSLSLLQRIFPTQGSNSGLLNCRQILYQLSYTSLVVQWLRLCLHCRGQGFDSLSGNKDLTCHRVWPWEGAEDKSSLEKHQRLPMSSLFSTLSFLHLYPLSFSLSLSVSLFLCACLRVFVWLPHIPGVHDR